MDFHRTTRITGLAALVLAAACALPLSRPALGAVTLLDNNEWKVLMGGFVEMDTIHDSTRSFNENIGNSPVQRPGTLNGRAGREQFSIRNSRLGFDIVAPETNGWKTDAYFEFDLLGYDPAPGSSNTEAGFFNNPTFRLRHGFLQAKKDGWQLLAGQTWALFGWQPYYFMPTVQVQPIPDMLYSRTPQFRAVKTVDFADQQHVQAALGVMRPPQRDASLPGLESGLRWSYDGWSAGFVGGGSPPDQVQPLSVGITGTVRDFSIPSDAASADPSGSMNHYFGHAIALDALLPVIPSRDGKDVGNTLVLGGELSTGTGYGDQYGGWTGDMASPLNSLSTAPNKNVDLDPGIGGFDGNGNFALVNLDVVNVYGQYHLPTDTHAWLSGGYGWLYSDNVDSLTESAASTSTVLYSKEQVGFANVMKDMTSQIRLGLEYALVRTTYADGTVANDNRYQFSAFFFF